jgi:hypothetical protein
MMIDGQGVCEIDIRASYLTIFHARHRAAIALDTDPYQIPGLPRDVVKTWCAVRSARSIGYQDGRKRALTTTRKSTGALILKSSTSGTLRLLQ